jgi:hypothetical protein
MLHAKKHLVQRAKFPVFDVHQHVNDAMGIEDHRPPEELADPKNNCETPGAK